MCLFWTEYVVSSDLGGGGQCSSCYSKTCWINPEAIPLRGSSEGLGIIVQNLDMLVNNEMVSVIERLDNIAERILFQSIYDFR